MVRDQEEGTRRQRLDPVALDPEVLPVEEPGHGEHPRGRVEPEAEALGRPPLEEARVRELRPQPGAEGAQAPEAARTARRGDGLGIERRSRNWQELRRRRHHSMRIGCRA